MCVKALRKLWSVTQTAAYIILHYSKTPEAKYQFMPVLFMESPSGHSAQRDQEPSGLGEGGHGYFPKLLSPRPDCSPVIRWTSVLVRPTRRWWAHKPLHGRPLTKPHPGSTALCGWKVIDNFSPQLSRDCGLGPHSPLDLSVLLWDIQRSWWYLHGFYQFSDLKHQFLSVLSVFSVSWGL